MKKIKMLVTKQGSQDGVTVQTFDAGKIYTISDSLADIFLPENWAELYIEEPEILTPEKPAKSRKTPERAKK